MSFLMTLCSRWKSFDFIFFQDLWWRLLCDRSKYSFAQNARQFFCSRSLGWKIQNQILCSSSLGSKNLMLEMLAIDVFAAQSQLQSFIFNYVTFSPILTNFNPNGQFSVLFLTLCKGSLNPGNHVVVCVLLLLACSSFPSANYRIAHPSAVPIRKCCSKPLLFVSRK